MLPDIWTARLQTSGQQTAEDRYGLQQPERLPYNQTALQQGLVYTQPSNHHLAPAYWVSKHCY